MKYSLWKTIASSIGYLLVATACMSRWNTRAGWPQLDWFVGSYLLLRLIGSLHSIVSSLNAFRSRQLREEWWSLHSDEGWTRWVMLLMALDLLVFLDYGHWHLAPSLQRPVLQIAGAALYVAVTFWQIWTDEYLARYFNHNGQSLLPMNRGPYRYVRHPRYAAAILGKIAMALIFASLLGWVLTIVWGSLLLHKMAIEEEHLRKLFGSRYESYVKTTARVVPGVY
jgi:protein-S-isoprenylcysteine O-methyltransferase Ste14